MYNYIYYCTHCSEKRYTAALFGCTDDVANVARMLYCAPSKNDHCRRLPLLSSWRLQAFISTMHIISICFFFFSKVLHVEAPLLWKAIILSELVPDVNRKERSHPRLVATEPALLTLKAAKNLYLHLVNLIQHYRCFFPFLFNLDV